MPPSAFPLLLALPALPSLPFVLPELPSCVGSLPAGILVSTSGSGILVSMVGAEGVVVGAVVGAVVGFVVGAAVVPKGLLVVGTVVSLLVAPLHAANDKVVARSSAIMPNRFI